MGVDVGVSTGVWLKLTALCDLREHDFAVLARGTTGMAYLLSTNQASLKLCSITTHAC